MRTKNINNVIIEILLHLVRKMRTDGATLRPSKEICDKSAMKF